ncbi:signal peptidase I [Candidatus Zixiibacteriota bacterium]
MVPAVSENEASPDSGYVDQTPDIRHRSIVLETVELVVFAVLIALFLRAFVIQAFRIPSSSMEDTLLVGDFILVDKVTFGPRIEFGPLDGRLPGLREPRTGDVVVFRYPLDPTKDFVKRLIAGPGQTVSIEDRDIYVDGTLVPEPGTLKHGDPRVLPGSYSNRDNFGPVMVPEGHYFFMGDNRENSKDSREWGFVPEENIKGKARIVYLSWNPDPTIKWFDLISKIRWGHLFERVR